MNDTHPRMFCKTVFYCTAVADQMDCAHYKKGDQMWDDVYYCAHDHDRCGKCDNPIAQVQALMKALKDRGVEVKG